MLTVAEVIEQLKKLPQSKLIEVEVGGIGPTFATVEKVYEQGDVVVLDCRETG